MEQYGTQRHYVAGLGTSLSVLPDDLVPPVRGDTAEFDNAWHAVILPKQNSSDEIDIVGVRCAMDALWRGALALLQAPVRHGMRPVLSPTTARQLSAANIRTSRPRMGLCGWRVNALLQRLCKRYEAKDGSLPSAMEPSPALVSRGARLRGCSSGDHWLR